MKVCFSIYLLLFIILGSIGCSNTNGEKPEQKKSEPSIIKDTLEKEQETKVDANSVDTVLFNKIQKHLVHNKPGAKWPVKTGYPLPGSLLPYNRIVAYYGNFYSKRMGILGQVKPDSMIKRLKAEVKVWEKADSLLPVIPAIHYISVTAQTEPGKAKKYRLRMPMSQIEKALKLANEIKGILILDIQTGHSSLEEEIPMLESYLKLPNVHLAIEPEYSMKNGKIPGRYIGSCDASEINYASKYLTDLVKKHNLPPKILIIHRFTKGMITNYKKIKLHPEVQMVINMDGFGIGKKKINSYRVAITAEPIQYAGFKLFYKNDKLDKPYKLLTPGQILNLYPSPVYIQYQ